MSLSNCHFIVFVLISELLVLIEKYLLIDWSIINNKKKLLTLQ
jgi:hypothetical protein